MIGELTTRLGELTTHLWQSTLFAVAAGLLTLAFRRNRAKVRFWLWLSASLKFFIPFTVLMNLGSHINWTSGAQKIATQITTPAVSIAAEFVAEPFPFKFAPDAPRGTDWALVAMIGLWTGGLLVIALMRLRLWLGVQAALSASTPLEIPAAVGIRSAPGLLEPGVVGLLKPVLLLPEGILDCLTPSQLEAVLAHELCHVRRRDNLFATIHMVVEAIFWFHPLVWWIGARLVEERERACDEDVLSLGSQPRVYADAILSVCKLYVESPLVCVSGVTGSDIRQRIEAIMTNRRGQTLNRAKKFLLATAGIAALAGPVAIGVVIGIGHVPAIHAQSPAVIPALPQVAIPSLAQVIQAAPVSPAKVADPAPASSTPAADPTAASPSAGDTVIRYKDRRLVAMLFDLTGLSAEEQTRVQRTAINFVQNDLKAADLVCIIVAGGGPLKIAQDFTDDPARLQSAIQSFNAGSETNAVSGIDARLATIATASKMLAGFPEKKALMYFGSGITQSGVDNQAALLQVINAAKNANVAIYPIDARGMNASAPGGSLLPDGAGLEGRGMLAKPEGVSQDEFNRRLAEAQQKFGPTNAAMSRVYVRYGPPDRVDSTDAPKPSQIWRYNYLPSFHSSVEFAFSKGMNGNGPWRLNINYPPPLATYSGTPVADSTLAEALNREGSGRGPGRGQSMAANVSAGLPGRHSSMGVYPAGESSRLSVPLEQLSGVIDIIAQVRTRPAAGSPEHAVANLRDSITLNGTSQSAMYGTEFTLDAGSYTCRVLVREAASGRIFTEIIDFDVK